MNGRDLGQRYQRAHDRMRDVEGLLPHEALDELLKFLFFKDCVERRRSDTSPGTGAPSHFEPSTIRSVFSQDLALRAPWAVDIWQNGKFHLSDTTLRDLQDLFADLNLSELPLDVRATALRAFLAAGSRRGMGIFLTPEDVVRTMVEIVEPSGSDVILDPACGSGTFLLESARYLSGRAPKQRPYKLNGVDKNPRMLLLADLNLGNISEIDFRRECADSLRTLGVAASPALDLQPASVDVILTNPPFGVTVTDTGTLDLFGRGSASAEFSVNRVPSEVLFMEQCLRMLRPGGRLGIVLPRSVFTNDRMAARRRRIDLMGHLTDLVELPPETFALTGTHTTTVAAFFRKDSSTPGAKGSVATVRTCHVTNVGFDSTGRHRNGNQLPSLPRRLKDGVSTGSPEIRHHPEIPLDATLQRSAELLFSRNGHRRGMTLRTFVDSANTGRTPGRSEYTDRGVFIVKVGNLTGRGIDWKPRPRNFVSEKEGIRRANSRRLELCRGDVLLTSSAHVARYIAKKVDVLWSIPGDFSTLTFSGEVTRVRPASGIDPFVLLAALRHPCVRQDLQASVRGQTAHLNPADLLSVCVPWDLSSPTRELIRLADLLREEASLAFRLSEIAARTTRLLDSPVAS